MFVPSATELVIVGGKNEEGAFDTVSIYTIATGINCFSLFYIALRYLTQAQFNPASTKQKNLVAKKFAVLKLFSQRKN
jgi:hypothetical protein